MKPACMRVLDKVPLVGELFSLQAGWLAELRIAIISQMCANASVCFHVYVSTCGRNATVTLLWRVPYVLLFVLGAHAAPCVRLPICAIVCAELWGWWGC